MKESVKITVPVVLRVRDYHEFDNIQDYYKLLGLRVKVAEIGVGEGGDYIGIAYLRKDAEYRALEKLCKEEAQGWEDFVLGV